MTMTHGFNNLNTSATADIYTDFNGLRKLKQAARKDAQAAIPEAAKQFEALMLTMMMKNLRKTGMEDPLFSSQAMDSYHDMYDQQLGIELSKGEGIGFAKAIAEQIRFQQGDQKQETIAKVLKLPERPMIASQPAVAVQIQQPTSAVNSIQSASLLEDNDQLTKQKNISASDPKINETSAQVIIQNNNKDPIKPFSSADDFVQQLRPMAEQAAKKLGVSADIILSQAALETGWGKYVIHNDSTNSFNLFNIKAKSDWSGKIIDKEVLEYNKSAKNNSTLTLLPTLVPTQQKSQFKVYDSYAQSFDDYVNYIQGNSRYDKILKKVLKSEQLLHDKSYIEGIHQAGYATDPDYSNKVLNVLKSDVFNNSTWEQRKS